MKHEVLRTFRIAADAMGVRSVELNPGDHYDVPEGLVASLEAEGYIKPATDTEPPPPVGPHIAKAEGRGKYDVIGADGAKVNEAPLSKADAEAALAGLLKGSDETTAPANATPQA